MITGLKKRAAGSDAKGPNLGSWRGERRKLGTCAAEQRGQTNFWEELSDANANLGVGGAEQLFGLAKVGAAFEQS